MRASTIISIASFVAASFAAPAIQRDEKRGFVTDDLDPRSFVTEDKRSFVTEPEKRGFVTEDKRSFVTEPEKRSFITYRKLTITHM
ncbi:cell surface protein precursor [Colletotrichum kahawae]|uniref:Cell surface protein n=1 Tax=Colletotrichum kahawae TaxID=34407 RepID=A0AAE0DC53_COLKA|nr:cell surface protein precursor [Colletotrichum kahawae]